jgi:hypothetical protein
MKFAHVVYVTAIMGFSRATRGSSSAFETNITNCGGVIIGGNELAPVTCFDSGPDAIDLSKFFENFGATESDVEENFDEIDVNKDDVLSIDELQSFFGTVKSGSNGSSGLWNGALIPFVSSVAAACYWI